MDSLFESNLVRNSLFGAVAIWQFSSSYHKQQAKLLGPSLPAAMLVLPMVFHGPTVSAIADRKRDGALLKALAADRTITVGLQRRVEGFAARTFKAINVAAAAHLVSLARRPHLQLVPLPASQPIQYPAAIQRIIKAADRLGHSIALSGLETCCSLLCVRF